MALHGTLDTFSLADLLQWLEINGLSGRVTLHHGDERRTIDLKRGSIVFVSSSRHDERLGIFLKKKGLLTEETIYDILAENFTTGKNMTRIIIDRKLLTRAQLAEAIESLAIQVLLDLFHWRDATFEFDPKVKTEDILRVQLSLRGQVMAFHGAKSIDDSRRIAIPKTSAQKEQPFVDSHFTPEALAETFFKILEETSAEGLEPAIMKARFGQFHRFSESLRKKLKAPFRVLPVFDDTAALMRAALERGGEPDHLIQIAALDQGLTLNLLFLANALRGPSEPKAGTPSEAAEAIGPGPLVTFFDHLSRSQTIDASQSDRLERIFRRASLTTAVAASMLAGYLGVDPELGYALGLLELMGGYDVLKLVLDSDFEPGPFRAGVLNEYRPLYGQVLAQKLNLPEPLVDIFGATGDVTSESSTPLQLIFFAKQLIPTERIGREFTSDDPELADIYSTLAGLPNLVPAITSEIERVRQIVNV